MNDADAADARVAVVSVGTEAEPASAEHCAVASHAVAGAALLAYDLVEVDGALLVHLSLEPRHARR